MFGDYLERTPCRRSGVNDHQRSQSARLKERSFLPLKPFPNFVICHRLVPGASSSAPGHGPSGSSGSRDGHRSAFDLGADFPVLPDFPELPWLRFAREVTTEDAKPSSEATSGLLGGMLTTAVSCDAGTVPLEVVNAGSMELNHIRSLVECPPDDAQPSAETTLPGNMLRSAVFDTNAPPREVTIADVSKLHQTPEDEALEGVFTVASEVPKVSVCDCSCESKSVFPVDAPAAKRLKVTPTQHDSIDATPCRGQPQFLPAPGPGPQSSPVGNPNPLPPSQWCLKITVGKDIRRISLTTLLLPLTMKFSWVSQPSSACRQPPSVPPFSSTTSTRKGTPAP